MESLHVTVSIDDTRAQKYVRTYTATTDCGKLQPKYGQNRFRVCHFLHATHPPVLATQDKQAITIRTLLSC